MADHFKTVSNSLNVFGVKPTNKWSDSFDWGDLWAYSDQDILLTRIFGQLVQNTITLDGSIVEYLQIFKTISNSQAFDGGPVRETITDPNGYNTVVGGSDNLENRPLTSYNSSSVSGTSYTVFNPSTTSWSEL